MLKNLKKLIAKDSVDSEIMRYGGDSLSALKKRYAYRVTDTIKSSIKGNIQSDPVAKQYIPQKEELKILPIERTDPIGDEDHSPVKGIVHRYPDRVLFAPANACAVYCRYCFRREKVGKRGEALPDILNDEELAAALEYIRSRPEIWEVILTGGDPLILSVRQLEKIMSALKDIEHIKIIRIHTRVPIADPKRINSKLIKALTSKTNQSVYKEKAIYMALHINHVQELTPETRKTIQALHSAGVNLLSQSVLLKNVNNNAKTLEELFRELIALNVKPYYLHHPDLAPGTSHFRLSIEEGQKIMQELQGRLSGHCLPSYMLDIPGGYGKIPLTPQFIEQIDQSVYKVIDPNGEEHTYNEAAE